jgi:tetratricopeptide (TPR) repeat protein
MHKITSILVGVLVFACSMTSRADATNKLAVAQAILDKLYLAAGQFAVAKPKLELSKENGKGAAYFYAKNLIVLDEKTYDICVKMGKDSSESLAFILAHELSHAFQRQAKKGRTPSNFLAYDQAFEADTRSEKGADINGVFTAYLAGYRLAAVLPKLLNLLYDTYSLTGKTIKGYPDLDERRRSVSEVIEITNELIDLYETSSYLLAASNCAPKLNFYDQAITNYEYILQYYQGREVYNNLGVLYLYQAMDYYPQQQTDRFVYPVEIDAATLMNKIRGGPIKDLSLQEKLARMQLLNKATTYFMQAIALDRNFLTAKLNYVCALALQQKPSDALAYFQKKKLQKAVAKNSAISEKYKMAEAIIRAMLNDPTTAEAKLTLLSNSKNQPVAAAARYNLEVLRNKEVMVIPSHEFQFPERFVALVKGITMPKMSLVSPQKLNEEGSYIKHLTEGSTETFSFGNKQGNVVSIIRFQPTKAGNIDLLELAEPLDRAFFYNLVSTNTGYFLTSKKPGDKFIIAIKVSNAGKVEEMAKLVLH